MSTVTPGPETGWKQNSALSHPGRARGALALVVLGAALAANGSVPPVLHRRLTLALVLARRFASAFVIVSGGATQGPDRPSEAEVMARWLEAHGVDRGRLLLEAASFNTAQNARYVVRLARERGVRRLLVITDRVHWPRALLFFRLEAGRGPQVLAVAAPGPEQWGARLGSVLREAAAFGRNAGRLLAAWREGRS